MDGMETARILRQKNEKNGIDICNCCGGVCFSGI